MTQPEALRLSQVAPYLEGGERGQWIVAAAAELHRLHDEVTELQSDLVEEVLLSNAMLEVKEELLAALKEAFDVCIWPGSVISDVHSKARAAIAKGEAK
jgi:hypothetical protein